MGASHDESAGAAEPLPGALRSRWEAAETARVQELASLTEERAREIIARLSAVDSWRERSDWSGFVEQQRLFMRTRRA